MIWSGARRSTAAGVRCAAAASLLLSAVCCGGSSLLERAIEQRGGELESFTREVEARVAYGFPGLWRWETAWLAPGRLRLSLATHAASHHYVFDGAVLRSYIGGALVTESVTDAAALRTIVRWMEVTSLDVLADGERVTWEELAPDALPAGAVRGIAARFRDDDARYVLGFDATDRLVAVEGPIDVPGIGQGRLAARYEDFRREGAYELAFATRYRLNDEPFFDEKVLRWAPAEASIDPTAP